MPSDKDIKARESSDAAKGVSDENSAWACFYNSGKIEDYIRYAQLKHDEGAADCAPGATDAGKDRGIDN